MHHSKPAASSASFDVGSQHDHNLLLHNRVEHDEVSDLILDQDEDHAASPPRTYYEPSGPAGTVERKSATPGASPSVASVLMSAIGGAFPMDDDFAPHSSSSSFDIGFPNFSSFGSGSSASSGGLDEHDLQFSSSPLHFPSPSRHTAPASSSQLPPLHAPPHRPTRDLDATQAGQQASIDEEEAKEIIARLYVASARPSPAWFEQHQCRSILHVTAADASSTTSSPSSEPMNVEMMDNGSPAHIATRTVVVVLQEHRSGGAASLDSSLKHAADVVHETLGLDPKRSVLLRAGAAGDGGDESEPQQRHEADEHEVVAATAMAYLVAGAKLSLRVAVEQLTTVLGSDRVQRMGDGFKRQLMAIETHVSRRPPSHDFFAPPSPAANVEAVASASASSAPTATAQAATKTIKAEGPDGWSSVSEGATNKMVVLSSSHPALPTDGSSASSSTSTQSSLRPPASAPQASSARSPHQSAPSTPMLSPRSSSQPTSPNPYGESDSPTDSAGGKRPRTESTSGSKEQPPSKRRGPYRCGRCGMPKRGHSCPESSKGQDGPSAQSPAVSTPNTSSLSSCPSTPAAPVVVAAGPKAELPPPASLPLSASCTDTSSASSLCSSTSAASTVTVATASDESANAARTPSAAPSGPAASAAATASPVSPSYDELMLKIAELTRDRDYYMNRYLGLLQDGTADHLPSGEQLQLQQRAVKLGVSSGLSTPDRRQPQPPPQQGLVSSGYPSPSRSSLAEHHQQRYQQQQQQQQQQQPGSVAHSPASAHSPSHPLPIGSRYPQQYYPQQQPPPPQHTHHALMRTPSTGDSAGGAAYSSPSSSPYLTRHVASSRSGLVSSSPAATATTAGGGRFTIGGRFGPGASGFYSPSHHSRTTREPNGGGPAFHFSSPFAHSSSTVATHPTQQPHFANPTTVAVAAAGLEDQTQQPPQAGQQSSTSAVASPSLGTSSSSPLSLKAAEDFFYWDDFCTTTNG